MHIIPVNDTNDASFLADEQTAINILESTFTNDITVTIDIGYGDYNGTPLAKQNVSEGGINFGYAISYQTLRTNLLTFGQPGFFNSTNLPNVVSIGGVSNFMVSSSVAKIFGMPTPDSNIDGFVGIGTAFTPGAERVSAFLHEIGHALGRVPSAFFFGGTTHYSELDLWRFTSTTGTRDFNSTNTDPGVTSWFSLDGGAHYVAYWGMNSDVSDFLNGMPFANDPFNESVGNLGQLTTADIEIMEALGFKTAPNEGFTQPSFQLSAFAPGAGGWSSDNTYPRLLGDVNGDGLADIVGFGNGGVYVALATGGGHFAAPSSQLAAFGAGVGGWTNEDTYPRLLGDVNGDGLADIVGFGSNGVYVALATGGGHFAAPSFQLAAFAPGAGGWSSDNTYPRLLGDVNGDGLADIVGFGNGGVYVALATGGGHFAAPNSQLAAFGAGVGGWTNEDTYPRLLGDVNGDGLADIVGFGSNGVYVALATGGGHFAAPSFQLSAFAPGAGGWTSDNTYPRLLADVNGDWLADIIGFGNGGVYVSYATGGGHFAAPSLLLSAYGAGAGGWSSNDAFPRVLADITGDHKADIIGFGSNGVYTSNAV